MPALSFPVDYWRTLIAAVLVVGIGIQRHSGGLLLLLIALFCVWLVYALVVIYRKPEKRGEQLIKMAIWLGVIALLSAVHWYRSETTRKNADHVVVLIEQYHSTHGSYPKSLASIGRDAESNGREWKVHYHADDKGAPNLLYSSPFTLFDTYRYDFEKRQWIYQPD
jgi:hypothetical protein